MKANNKNTLRSVTRFAIGGLSLGIEALVNQVQKSEDEFIENHTLDSFSQVSNGDSTSASRLMVVPDNNGSPENLGEKSRYALIGAIFNTQSNLKKNSSKLQKIAGRLNQIPNPVISTFRKARLFGPIRRPYDSLVDKGDGILNRWVALGRAEYYRSRIVAQDTIDNSVDDVIGDLSDNKEIQELITAQSVGLAGEVVEEVRERGVSADTYFEGLLRAWLRKKPRSDLPGAPESVRQRAILVDPVSKASKE